MELPEESHDIVVIGAGMSGINAAHRIKEQFPNRTFAILEARPVIGGTWSFFKFPGIRSDSSLRIFGFAWHPWRHRHMIATAPEIFEYLTEVVTADGLLDKVRLRHRVVDADWSSSQQRWRLTVDADGSRRIHHARFVIACCGYYSYDRALDSPIPGMERFSGTVVHPQWWPDDLDYADRRVVVVGSGATAFTLVPVMARQTKSITMLQRSPSYVVSRPRVPALETLLRRILPLAWVIWISRLLGCLNEIFFVELFTAWPRLGRWLLTSATQKAVPDHVDVAVHFNPRYDPFQQRLCMTPDGEFFDALRRDNCEIVTDIIETVTETGIRLRSGRELEADIIVTATGLHLEFLGGLAPKVDGNPVDIRDRFAWRGCLLEGLPNIALVIGHSTTTWMPGADASTFQILRVMRQMEAEQATVVMPVVPDREKLPRLPVIHATSSYFVRAFDRLPKAAGRPPFQGRISLLNDVRIWLFGGVKDGLVYSGKDAKKTN